MTKPQSTPALPAIADRFNRMHLPLFRQIAALALEYKAVNLAGGTPDFPAPEELKAAGIQAITDNHNQYALSHGLPALREGIADRLKIRHGLSFDPNTEITVGCGSTEVMTASLLAVVNPGDEVIVLEPAFTSYAPSIVLSGGTPVFVHLDQPDFRIDAEKLEAAISPRTKAIILNSPHNPTGTIFSREELQIVADLCLKYNLLALTDEIYDEIVFDNTDRPVLWTLPDMRERTLAINGFSKTYSVTGWRIGYVVAPPAYTPAVRIAHNYLAISAPAPLQTAAITAIRFTESYYQELRTFYHERRDLLLAGLSDLGFTCKKPQGGYFVIAGFEKFSSEDDLTFAKRLIQEFGVAATPVSAFYSQPAGDDHRLLRFAFCKTPETIQAALTRLQKLPQSENPEVKLHASL